MSINSQLRIFELTVLDFCPIIAPVTPIRSYGGFSFGGVMEDAVFMMTLRKTGDKFYLRAHYDRPWIEISEEVWRELRLFANSGPPPEVGSND